MSTDTPKVWTVKGTVQGTTKVWTAAEMGRKGGRIGGKAKVAKGFARATPEQRREWGRKGAAARKNHTSKTRSVDKTGPDSIKSAANADSDGSLEPKPV